MAGKDFLQTQTIIKYTLLSNKQNNVKTNYLNAFDDSYILLNAVS